MKLLENPEDRYGPLPTRSFVERELKPHKHLQTNEGAWEYLELHLARVEECFAELQKEDNNIWGWLARKRATSSFTNTTKALRVIIKYHEEDLELLTKMRKHIETKAEERNGLEPHYRYLLGLLDELLAKHK
ncbi:MAG: hypothetical protein FH749_10180 [Firmicutes bacterium]|nr:hypothetical protein [Bacillota bacterium]